MSPHFIFEGEFVLKSDFQNTSRYAMKYLQQIHFCSNFIKFVEKRNLKFHKLQNLSMWSSNNETDLIWLLKFFSSPDNLPQMSHSNNIEWFLRA